MQPDQKKKIFIVAGILGVLLIGALVVLFGGVLGSSDDSKTSPATAGGAPSTSQPAPPPPSRPATPSQGTMTPNPVAPPSTMTMTQTQMSTMAPAEPKVTILDPFAPAAPRKIVRGPGVPPKSTDPAYIPVWEIPGVAMTGAADVNGGAQHNDQDGFKFDETRLPSVNKQANGGLGRNAGWISNDGQGRVTAFFVQADGTCMAVGVGSVVNGKRVRAIDANYVLLVDEKCGVEERIKLQGGQNYVTGARDGNVTMSAGTSGYGTR